MPPFIADNLDYLLFALASAAVFFALGRVLRRRSAEARLPRATWWIVLAVLGLGWSFVDRAGRAERRGKSRSSLARWDRLTRMNWRGSATRYPQITM